MANHDVFISYKAEELDEATWVKSVLESNGISCWMAPSSLPGGSSYAAEIPQAIRNCKVFVLLLSAKAQASKWVSREVDLAINAEKTILPFMLENCALKDEFNFYLTNVQRYTAYENKVIAAEKMVSEIRAMLNVKADQATPAAHTESEIKSEEKAHESVVPQKSETKPVTVKTPDQEAKKKLDVFSIISLVLGLISLSTFGLFVVTEIVGIVFAILGIKDRKNKMPVCTAFCVAGLVMGILTMLVAFAFFFGAVGVVVSLILSAVSIVLFVLQSKK